VDWVAAMAILAIATQTIGNVLAIPQRSVKRMLAYSSIAQVGYIMIALPVGALAFQATSPTDAVMGVAAYAMLGGLLHVMTHAAMKGGAFLVVAGTQSVGIADDMDAYRGLAKRMPFLAFSMTIILLSLAGIPPLAGFFSKFVLFSSAINAMPYNPWFLALAVSGVLNSALSLYYYSRVIWYMYILEPDGAVAKVSAPRSINASVLITLIVVIGFIFFAGFFLSFLQIAARGFFGV
jgi:NADH-quinone oxidoreductase subunit N